MESEITDLRARITELEAERDDLADRETKYRAAHTAMGAEIVSLKAALAAQPVKIEGELPPLPELESESDIDCLNGTPDDWDEDYKSTWKKLQIAERNKMQWRAYALQLRTMLSEKVEVALSPDAHAKAQAVCDHYAKLGDKAGFSSTVAILRAALAAVQPAAPQEPFHHFGLSAEEVGQLLQAGLKPEEIGGADDVQHDRVGELVRWFARFTQGHANPKWATRHACELAYFIATNGINRHIDLAAVKNAAFKEGVNITSEERGTLERIGFATPRAPTAPDAAAVRDTKRLDFIERNSVCKYNSAGINWQLGQYDMPGRYLTLREAIDCALAVSPATTKEPQ